MRQISTRSTKVQTVIFDRKKWAPAKARRWLSEHGYETPSADTTKDYLRYRQQPPFNFKKGTFRTINFGRATGITAVIAVPRDIAKKNPTPKKTKPRIPDLLVDIADVVSVELENGDTFKFSRNDNWALCASRGGNELWILSRRGAKRVQVTDERGAETYETFTGWEHDETGRMVQKNPQTLKRIGRAINIVYWSDKFARPGKTVKYIHAFQRYPTVSVDSARNPTIIALRGGRIQIKEEGIAG